MQQYTTLHRLSLWMWNLRYGGQTLRLDSHFWLVRVSVSNLGIAEGSTVQPSWSTDSRQPLWKFQWHWFSEIKKSLKSPGIPNSQKILKKKNKAGGLILPNFKTHYKAVIMQSVWSTSLAVQWLRLPASTAGGMGSIPGEGTKILHVTQRDQKKGQRTWIDSSPKRTYKCNKHMKICSASLAAHVTGWLHFHFH